MPQGDRTGPDRRGPRTGRGMGFCSGANQPGFVNPGFGGGRGLGRGFGMGRGFGRGRFAGTAAEPITLPKEEQKRILEAEAAGLEAELKIIKEKLKDFE